MQVRSLGQEDPLEEGMATYSSILSVPCPHLECGKPLDGTTGCRTLDSVSGSAWALGSWVKPGLLQAPAKSRVSEALGTHP